MQTTDIDPYHGLIRMYCAIVRYAIVIAMIFITKLFVILSYWIRLIIRHIRYEGATGGFFDLSNTECKACVVANKKGITYPEDPDHSKLALKLNG